MPFVSDLKPPSEVPETARWFIFHDQRLLVRQENEHYIVPETRDLAKLKLPPAREKFLGRLDGDPCYVGEWPHGEQISGDYTFIGLRHLFVQAEEGVIRAAGLANHLVHWDHNHQYCGRCGNPTRDKADERAKICTRCGLINYPRLSPAIIVAVLKHDQILLAHAKRFPGPFYSVLAGFVEPGERLEECVQREIREEVGITVQNIRYFGSQPWPFPDSLMIAFTAEYAGGEIRIDDSELTDAGWFSANRLPALPSRISIARQLIDWFLENR